MSDPAIDGVFELVLPPNEWRVTLRTGETLTIYAHAVEHEQIDDLSFKVLLNGNPHFEREVARIPKTAVTDWSGGGEPTW